MNSKLRDAFREVKCKTPDRVRVVREKHGDAAAERMRRAIAFDKARANGAKV